MMMVMIISSSTTNNTTHRLAGGRAFSLLLFIYPNKKCLSGSSKFPYVWIKFIALFSCPLPHSPILSLSDTEEEKKLRRRSRVEPSSFSRPLAVVVALFLSCFLNKPPTHYQSHKSWAVVHSAFFDQHIALHCTLFVLPLPFTGGFSWWRCMQNVVWWPSSSSSSPPEWWSSSVKHELIITLSLCYFCCCVVFILQSATTNKRQRQTSTFKNLYFFLHGEC